MKKSKLLSIIKLLRPKHWLKNVLVFISITFTGRIFEYATLIRVMGGFFAFSLLSSAVYTLNDIQDVEADRNHEVKKLRPVAAGEISIPTAYIIFFVLIMLSVLLDITICGFAWNSFLLMVLYFIVNLGYSLGLKNISFLDIILLVLGFLIRVQYGAAIINEGVSKWVLLTVLSLSFYLGLGKRRNEIKKSNGQPITRSVLKYYSFNFLDKFMYLCLALAIVFYALWSADDAIILKYGTDKLIWTVPFVICIMMKYSADIESDSYGDPVDVITHDKVLLLLAAVYVCTMFVLIYFPKV